MNPIRAELVMFDVDARTLGYRFSRDDFKQMVQVCNRLGDELLLTPERCEQTTMPPMLPATLKHRLEEAIANIDARVEEEDILAAAKSILLSQKNTMQMVVRWIEEERKDPA